MWLSWIRAVTVEGTTKAYSTDVASFPPLPPVHPTVVSPNSRAASSPFSTFGELPLVLMAITTSPFWPWASQSWELTVPARDWIDAFHAAHLRQFGFDNPGAVIEAVSLRVEATAAATAAGHARFPAPPSTPGTPGATTRVLHAGEWLDTALWHRSDLAAGQRIHGPAVVLEYSATLWIPPLFEASVLSDGVIVVEM